MTTIRSRTVFMTGGTRGIGLTIALRRSDHAHVLTLSPPLENLGRWLGGHSPYTLSKMGMTMITLGIAADEPGIGANCLWPRTTIATAAIGNFAGEAAMSKARSPQIMADAAAEVLRRDPRQFTGHTLIDDEVLAEAGITDVARYSPPATELMLDIFVDDWGAMAVPRSEEAR